MNFLEGKKRAFFIGVGGIGMSALARYLFNKGIEVYGYDRTETKLTKKLVSEGMNIHYTDDVEFIPTNIDIVVYTPAIPADHKQKNWFIDNDFTLYKRSELLKEILNESRVIAVAGTHGKTSTSSMLSHIMKGSDNEVTCFVGGIMVNYNTNFLYGSSKWVVIEADEYDRSFLTLYPDIAIIQALDPDHLDIYGTGEEMVESYREFTLQIKNGGMLVVPDHVRDMMSKDWLAELEDKNISTIKYGSIKEADKKKTDINVISLIAKELNTDVVINCEGREIVLNVLFPGRHNALNSVGASIIAHKMGMSWDSIRKQISTFKGIWRRFEVIHKTVNQIFIDDYAHHPMEIKAMVGSLRKSFPGKKISVVFLPHLFTRTRDFVSGFAEELDQSDEVILLPIYPARELPINGVTSQIILDRMKLEHKKVVDKEELINELKSRKIEV
ncbi:MAG: UDP-N-acetylmuramate--L-alanine ligase, partial [Saprospiraceae bacterium]|nr:UDP-N-acetylmuramate--L-alanine ligase [Saprospiraceae bacterium]